MAKGRAKFSLKLLIDEEINKVVLAEADQDFVDVLISLLSLPMGRIAKLLENHKNVLGCYKNLNKSVADLVIDNFKTEASKSLLLNPMSVKEIHWRRLKLNMGDTDNATRFCMCEPVSISFLPKADTSICSCGGFIRSEIQIPKKKSGGVFVNCRSSFIITDDLNVTTNSTGVLMKVLKDLGYLGFSDLRETVVDVGFEEVVTLLGCLLTSEATLTCTFLRKDCITNMHKMLSPPVPITGSVEPSSVFSVKVYVRKFDREILYAECNEDFVDSLLTFLILPLELAFSLSNDNTILGRVGNLCRIPFRRASESNFDTIPGLYSCKNNSLFCNFSDITPSYDYDCLDSLINSTGFMKKNTKFIVTNDLVITPMHSSSTIGLLKKVHVDISDLEEHQISISKAELISILRASLISSSALTNGLTNLLVKKPKEET